ncbi:DUF2125 domain-containing protein [Paremcibacter congregatus]|uniref:DUF2125 domain-containing protein n=1 Tax=Paremcibacter congregatus TaxID=2043170 RepID=A0A2G4YPY5_9PROT|nr:DUF2125 domain-containing protein [Paremcibacter congregatus]PHZ84365.1 hypothetical protein CRD36_11145 [Paremcibacter congregatus]QDE28585.1 DUF2125 domain-containing protein [Paremcibacter congregatus]
MRLKLLGLVIGGVVLGYTVFWHYMAGEVEDQIEAMVNQQRNQGVSIKYGDLDISGFPYRMELALKDLKVLKTGNKQKTITMTTPLVTLVAFPWKINHGVIVSEGGTMRIGGRRNPDFMISFGPTRASVMVDIMSRKLNRASFVLNKVTWAAGKFPKTGPTSQAGQVKLHFILPETAVSGSSMELPLQAKMYMEAADVVALEVPVGTFGKKANLVTVDIAIHGKEMPQYNVESLKKWRDDGGTLAVKTVEITSGVMDMDLSGETSLDQNMMPLGAFSAKIHGVDHIIKVLSGHDAFKQEPGKQILVELKKMSHMEETGPHAGTAVLDLPVSLQNGLLFLGPIPVAELSPVLR